MLSCSLLKRAGYFSTHRMNGDKKSLRLLPAGDPAKYFQSFKALAWGIKCFSGSGIKR